MRIRFDRKYNRFQVEAVQAAIVKAVAASRFTLSGLELQWREGRWELKLGRIRLRNKKDYCGQHPGPCQVDPFRGGRKHPVNSLLEGSDWLGFNDGLNDILDELDVVADVFSYNRESFARRFYVRKGCRRRVGYSMTGVDRGTRVFYAWDAGDEVDFVSYCGRTDAPRSEYPPGTPGLACWTLEDEARLAKEFTHAD